jgi:hypothetical protein
MITSTTGDPGVWIPLFAARRTFMQLKFVPIIFVPAVLACTALLPVPALAQFDVLRPPGTVDSPQQDRYPGPPQSYPAPAQQQPAYPPQSYPPQGRAPAGQRPNPYEVQSQPLPPPGQPGQPNQPSRRQALPPEPAPPQAAPKSKAQANPKTKGAPKQAAPDPNNPNAPEAAEVPVEQAPLQRISNPTAVFSGLDKITGRIINFEAAIDETVQFGALQVTPRACYTRPATEIQNTTSFVEVDEITLAGDIKRIFTGWMFANSPGLHAVEHPIYDVWITDCKTTPPAVAQSDGKQ